MQFPGKWCFLQLNLVIFVIGDKETKQDASGEKEQDAYVGGASSFHLQKSRSGSCGYPASRLRMCRLFFLYSVVLNVFVKLLDNWRRGSEGRLWEGKG